MNAQVPLKSSTLASLKAGQTAIVFDILGETVLARRLLEMGLVPGTRLHVIRRAPLGDPIEIEVRGYLLTLRVLEAENVRVAF